MEGSDPCFSVVSHRSENGVFLMSAAALSTLSPQRFQAAFHAGKGGPFWCGFSNEHPEWEFRRYSDQAYYYNGDYYAIRIEPNDRFELSTN